MSLAVATLGHNFSSSWGRGGIGGPQGRASGLSVREAHTGVPGGQPCPQGL